MFQRPVTDIRIIRYARNWPVTTTSNDKVLKMLDKAADNHNFDFNIGHLVKSPCKACPTRENFPGCMEDCELLDQIQSVLSDSISSANNYSVMETFDVPSTVLDQIWSVTGLSLWVGAGYQKYKNTILSHQVWLRRCLSRPCLRAMGGCIFDSTISWRHTSFLVCCMSSASRSSLIPLNVSDPYIQKRIPCGGDMR